ncbi:Zn-ribbon domain-containing OB-fold protein [Piscinibacter sp.]|jgi:uncharacterized OB-fold protein|uniref:Zn-ribbon domain-containing OB-fold protein n=1 Tax=Piscinibacter sp. TaxID=1903157 RepID=UPI0035594665
MSQPVLACPSLLRLDGGRPSLIGSRCADCGEVYFPSAASCTRCLGTRLESYGLGSTGVLWSWTIQGFLPKPPYNSGETAESFQPYGVGYVEMACGIKVESRLTLADPALLRIGMPMALTIVPYRVAEDGKRVSTFAFEPSGECLKGDEHV